MNPRYFHSCVRRDCRRLGGFSLLLTLTAVPWLVRAQEETIRVEYSAPDGCTEEDRFDAEIMGRTARVRLAKQFDGFRRFSAAIVRDGTEFVGSVEILTDGQSSARREVRGEECAEVASALALMIAVAVDPNASTAPASSIPTASASPSNVDVRRPPLPAPTPSLVVVPAAEPAPRWEWSVIAGAAALGGIAPDTVLGGSALAEARLNSSVPLHAIGLGASYADNRLFGGGDRSATVRAVTSDLRACPWAYGVAPKTEWMLCARTHVGAVFAEGRAVSHPTREIRPFLSLEASSHMRWQFRPGWLLEFGAGAYSPLTRCKFVFTEPKVVVYQMPWVGWSLSLGMGYRFL